MPKPSQSISACTIPATLPGTYSISSPLINAFAILVALLVFVPTFADQPHATSSDEIIRGFPAATDGQPWMVALVLNTTRTDLPLRRLQFCGGSLIAPQWVLTAAHCVLARSVRDMSLVVGQSNLDSSEIKLSKITQIVIHPRYDAREFSNDIALLRLESPALVDPLPLFTDFSDSRLDGVKASVYGWGQTYIFNEKCKPVFANSTFDSSEYECKIFDLDPGSREHQAKLLGTELTLMSDADCLARIEELLDFLKIPHGDLSSGTGVSSQICGYDPDELTGVCFGDSGGPLVIEVAGKKYHAGVSSLIFGSGGCSRELATDIFTKTAAFIDFIDEITHRDYALSFESFCPPRLEPKVEYTAQANGNSTVRVYWSPYARATGYTLRFSSYPVSGNEISSVFLDRSSQEVSSELPAGSSLYVSVQTANEHCSGPMSEPLIVQVPLS